MRIERRKSYSDEFNDFKLKGKIEELMRTHDMIKTENLESCADYEKSKVIHLKKMRKFSFTHYNGK